VTFTTTEFKNGFVPDQWLQTSAQHVIPESRVRNMPGVRGRVIEIEICSRSHCWFPPIENKRCSRIPKNQFACGAQARSRRFETFLWGNAYRMSTLSRHRASKVSESFSVPGLRV
jgi:hypothetical protein